MILINEWLPNPEGSDSQKEWIELYNSSKFTADLTGWRITNNKGEVLHLTEKSFAPDSYLQIRATSKFTLRNSGEGLILTNASGQAVTSSSYVGPAPSGLSFSMSGAHHRWLTPTPGTPNPVVINSPSIPTGVPLHPPAPALLMVGTAALLALALTTISLYLIRTNHELNNLFFGRN
jgi:hypothetical protein